MTQMQAIRMHEFGGPEVLGFRTGGQADLVVDVVGAPTLRESLHAVRPGGRVVVLGNVEGKEVGIPPADVTEIVPVHQARDVHEQMEQGRGSGRCVLEVAGG